MAKPLTVKIIKAFEITPGKKYLVILPSYIASDPQVGAALTHFFEGNPFIGLMVKKPEDIQIIEAGDADAETD